MATQNTTVPAAKEGVDSPTPRAATVRMGDREYTLRYDLNALAEIGDRLNIRLRLAHINEDLMSVPLPLSALRVLVWAGVRHEAPELEPEDVGALVDQDNMMDVVNGFFSLFGASWADLNQAAMPSAAAIGEAVRAAREEADSASSPGES